MIVCSLGLERVYLLFVRVGALRVDGQKCHQTYCGQYELFALGSVQSHYVGSM